MDINLINILKKEATNNHSIFLWERADGTWISYEYSAYIMAKLFPNLKSYRVQFNGEIELVATFIEGCSKNTIDKTNKCIQINRNGIHTATDEDVLEWRNTLLKHQSKV